MAGWRAKGVIAIFVGLLAWDLVRPPDEQLTARLLLRGIDLYQVVGSPVVGAFGARCRFNPSCSHYAEVVISRHGSLVGSSKAIWRVVRCGPWTPMGTQDPP